MHRIYFLLRLNLPTRGLDKNLDLIMTKNFEK